VSGTSTPAWAAGPPGSTPLDPDEAEGLLPAHITTQGELNAWEQLNIARADAWAMSRRRRRATTVLTSNFAVELHRRMFDETWRWAGTYRRTGKNIGVPASEVRIALRERVLGHPWPNGNGRWSRLMADTLLHGERQPRFSWGGGDLVCATSARADYLAALRAADQGDFAPLLGFVRR
jgi:fido (protein-threonine AMPylation protein)